MSTHLAAPERILCDTPAVRPAKSAELANVTCKRCLHKLDAIAVAEADAAAERRRLAVAAEDCRALGISHLWEKIADAGTPSERIARDILASLARFFVEDGRA